MMIRSLQRQLPPLLVTILATGLLTEGIVLMSADAALAGPAVVRPTREPRQGPRPRPTRQPRPTRRPGPHETPATEPTATATPTSVVPTQGAQGTPTATATATAPVGPQGCPGLPVTCPAPPACRTGNKIGQLYYKYPASNPIITNRVGEFRLNPASNGINPVVEGGSFSLVDKDNKTVVQLTDLHFQSTGNGWLAENEHGWVSISPKGTGDGYNFQIQVNDPSFPPGYFSVVYQMCLSIGDDGIDEQIVCQPKARDAFLCHNNGPTFFE